MYIVYLEYGKLTWEGGTEEEIKKMIKDGVEEWDVCFSVDELNEALTVRGKYLN
jgi:hypothetical protein